MGINQFKIEQNKYFKIKIEKNVKLTLIDQRYRNRKENDDENQPQLKLVRKTE